MAGKKNDAIELDAILNPELGDTAKVERQLSQALQQAAKPMVDTITDTKVGLNPAALRKVQKQLSGLAADFGDGFGDSINKVLGEQNKNLRSAKGLRELAKSDAGIAKMVRILGGYDQAASILGRPDAQRRLMQISKAFQGLNDTAYQISRLPAISSDTQKLLTKLYKTNTPGAFKKLNEVQQRQVQEAMQIIDLQDTAFRSLRNSLAKAGMGSTAVALSKQIKARKDNATRLRSITSPEAMAREERRQRREVATAQERQERLQRTRARTVAVSQYKDQVLRRTGGVAGLREKSDISAVRAGLNRDYNLAVQQLALDALGRGGRNSTAYRGTNAQLAGIVAQREELARLVKDQQEAARQQQRNLQSQMRAEQQQMEAREKARKKAASDEDAWNRKQAEFMNREFDRQAKLAARPVELRNPRASNLLQARELLRSSQGDFSELDRDQVRTLQPYLRDRYRQRSQHAERIGASYGTDSPEFARASSSAQQYAKALGDLDTRARALRPTISDLGQVVRSFFRYALGYGALYEMLGAVTALGRGLVDLDEQLYNIQAITLSTDGQMQTIEGSIKQVGLTTKFTLNEVAKGAQILAQAGTVPEAIPQQLRAVADFAAATGSSLEQSADLLTSFKNVYKEISDGSAADLLAKTLNLSKLQGEDLRTIISYTAQTAEGYNISAEQLMGAVATLRNVGIKPSTIATGLRQAMLEVFNPDAKLLKALTTRYSQLGEEMSAEQISARYNSFTFAENPLVAAVSELKRIGFGGEASNLFSRAFDVRAFNPLQALVNNFEQFNSLATQVGVGRTAVEGSKIQLESLRATLENLGASVVAFSDSVSGDMLRSLQGAAEEVTNLISKLTELDQQMKMDTGVGLSSSIMAGLGGGAVGALLGGKGFLGRAGGFTAGAVAAGGLTQASNSQQSEGSDYILPTVAALSVLVPGFLKIATAFKNRAGANSLQLGLFERAAGAAPIMDGIGKTVEGLAGMTGKLGKFSGLARIGMLGAGLFARAIPIIGWIWTAYEILSLFSEKGAGTAQDMANLARTRANAAGDQYRTLQTKYNDQQSQIGQYRIDANGNAAPATTASTLVSLRGEAENLNLALNQTFGAGAEQLAQATSILAGYQAKSHEARQADLQKLSALAGRSITDLQATDLATQVTQLQQGVEGIRQQLSGELQRSLDRVKEAVASGDSAAVEQEGAMLRVLDSMPELKKFFYGEIELSADRATELYIEFSRKLAEESEKGAISAEEVLAAKVKDAVLEIDAAAAALDSSSAINTAVRGIIDGLALTEKFVVKSLDAMAEKARTAAAEHAAEASRLEGEAKQERSDAESWLSGWMGEFGGLFAPGLINSAQRKEETAAGLRRQQGAQEKAATDAEAESARRAQADRVASGIARTAAQDVESQILGMLDKGRITPEIMERISATDRATLQALQGGDRSQLVQGGFFKPEKLGDSKYQQSAGVKQLERIIRLVQQTEATQSQVSDQKKSEAAKAAYASDPTVMVQIAKLQNQQKAAERRNDFAGASAAAKQIANLQYGEQQKAVKRAEVEMEAAKEDPKKDATAAVERYNSELAKLESLRGDMADKLDEYQKKVQDIDLKARTVKAQVDRDKYKSAFDEAINRGDLDKAAEYSQAYARVQSELLDIAKSELAAKGYSPEQIELEVSARKDLTTALIDQEGAQKRLTSAILARADFEARYAGTGPSTGSKAVDAYLEESGVGFSRQQYAGAFERDLKVYQTQLNQLVGSYEKQMATLVEQPEEARAAQQQYIQAIEEVQGKIGTTAAKLKQLRNDFTDELLEGLNPSAMANQLSQSQNSLSMFGENLRSNVITAIDGVGQALADAALNGEDLGDSLQRIVYEFASSSLTQGLKLGVTEGAVGLLEMIAGDDGSGDTAASQASSILGQILGVGGGAESYGTAQISAGTVFVNGALAGVPGGGDNPLANVFGPPAGAGTPATEAAKTGSLFDGLGSTISGSITDLKTGLTDSLTSLGGLFTGLLGGLFGGGGDSGGSRGSTILKWAVGTVASYYGGNMGGAGGGGGGGGGGGAGGYTGAFGFKDGGQPSRVIRGRRGGRDNLVATALVGGKAQPIKVESDEGILSRKAMSAIGGEAGLKILNSGRMPGYSVGGAPAPGYNPGGRTSTGNESLARTIRESKTVVPAPQVNVANIYSEDGFADFVSSRRGRKVIINELKKEGAI